MFFVLRLWRSAGPIAIGCTVLSCSLLAPSRDELAGGRHGAIQSGGMGGATGGEASDGSAGSAEGGAGGAEGGQGGAVRRRRSGHGRDGRRGPPPYGSPHATSSGRSVKWTQITPSGIDLSCPNGVCPNSGTQKFVLDPQNAGTIYLGTDHQGIWKSTDCGDSWSTINTGTNGLTIGAGRQENFVIDPVDTKVLYTRAGSGEEFKSINGGVDWAKIWPSTDPMLNDVTDFIEQLDLDPCGSSAPALELSHRLQGRVGPVLSRREPRRRCDLDHAEGAGPGSGAGWFVDSNRLVFGMGQGLWRSPDHGATWSQLADQSIQGVFGRMYRAKNGYMYLGAIWGILMSTDGDSWSQIANSGESMHAGITGDGTNLYRSNKAPCFDVGMNQMFYATALESAPKQWNAMQSPGMTQGGYDLGYDVDHHVFYSSNCRQGFWRVVTR